MNHCDRDENGWRIPRGTRSRAIYDMMRSGTSPSEMARVLGCTTGTVRVLQWKIKHPDEANEAIYAWWRNKRHRDNSLEGSGL